MRLAAILPVPVDGQGVIRGRSFLCGAARCDWRQAPRARFGAPRTGSKQHPCGRDGCTFQNLLRSRRKNDSLFGMFTSRGNQLLPASMRKTSQANIDRGLLHPERLYRDCIGYVPAGSMVNSGVKSACDAVRTTATSPDRVSATKSRCPSTENAMADGPSPT